MKVKVISYIVSYDSATDYKRVARRKATRALIERMGYTPIEGTEIEVDDSVLVHEQTPMEFTVPMRTFQVRLYPDGDYKKIEATSAKEAAEERYGRELSETGSNHQLRVMVHEMKWPRDPSPTLFYDRV